jgi:long-chain acyl-CoA synthetase
MALKLATLNDIFFHVAERNQPRVMSAKLAGQWVDISSAELRARVLGLAATLRRWGLKEGDRVAILSENRPEWQIADFACLLIGVVDVPIYSTLLPDQISYLLNNSGARVMFVSTREQLQKVLALKAKNEIHLERIVVMDDSAAEAGALRFQELLVPPSASEAAEIEAQGHEVRPSDLATIIYTSGTTGTPKGAMLTHGNIASNLQYSINLFQPQPGDRAVSFLPLSHITARHVDYAFLQNGVSVAYCPHMEDLPQVLLEVRPNFIVAVPRVYEKVFNKVQHEASRTFKRPIYNWALKVGAKHVETITAGKTPQSWEWKLARTLVFSRIRQGFGGCARYFISGGAPLGRELATWYAKVGICIHEGYGLTETSPIISLNTPGRNRLGTVGPIVPILEVRIAPDGELLVRGPNVFQGYWQLPEETKAAFEDGWFKTGDIGSLDQDGFLTITDRKKDLIKTSGGKFIAPQPLETSLKINPMIAQAAIIGDRRKFPAVLISPNFAALEQWARSAGVDFSSRQQLVQSPRVHQLYEGIVSRLNQDLAQYEKLKKIIIVPDEFSVSSGELTPSMKLKRRVVEQKYHEQIESLYASAPLEVHA